MVRRRGSDTRNTGVEHAITAGGERVSVDGQQRAQRAITAAAMTIDLKDKRVVKRLKSFRQDWQAEAWSYYRTTPLVGFGADFIANAMSRLRFHVAWRRDVSDWPNEIDIDDPPEEMDLRVYGTAQNILARLDSGQGLMEMARKGAYGLTLPGEVVVLGREDVDPVSGRRVERFDAYSTSEIDLSKAERGEISVRSAPSGMAANEAPTFKIDPATAWFFRVWRPDPEFSQLASTPMQRVLEQCEEQGLLRRYMRGSYRSRLNAGVFEVPAEWGMGPTAQFDENGNGYDKLADDLVTALMTAVGDEASAATVVPYVIHAPLETLGKARHITFDRTFDDRAMEMRRRLDEEIASGLDLPDQVLLGLGDVKFRNAEVITEEQFKLHLEPLAIVWVTSLTVGFLLPMLVADGVDLDVARQFVIWYDAAAITSDPDQSAASNYGYDRGLLSGRAWINANNFTEEDMPDDEELAARQEGLPWPIVKPQIPGQPPGAEQGEQPVLPAEPAQPPPVDGNGQQPPALAAAGGRPTRPLVRNLGRRLATAESMARMKVQLAADQAMRRGFERIGAATRTKARDAGGPQALAMVKSIDNAAVVTYLGVETCQRLGVDPQRHLDIELTRLEGRFRELVQAHQYRAVSMLATATRRPVEQLVERSAASWARAVDHAWSEFQANLNKLAHDELFLALVAAGPQQRSVAAAAPPPVEADARLLGEFDATVTVPAGLVREALSIAGGTTLPGNDTPESMSGVAGGPIMDDLMAEAGVAKEAYEWLYGDAATRTRPFEPHEALGSGGEDGGGVRFVSYDDPVLANGNDFPPSPFYFPGDHAGCQCEVAQRLIETVPAVVDPVAPSTLRERGLTQAPPAEAEYAKSRVPSYTQPRPVPIQPAAVDTLPIRMDEITRTGNTWRAERGGRVYEVSIADESTQKFVGSVKDEVVRDSLDRVAQLDRRQPLPEPPKLVLHDVKTMKADLASELGERFDFNGIHGYAKFEDNNIHLHYKLMTDEVRGLEALNTASTATQREWTIAHEYGHRVHNAALTAAQEEAGLNGPFVGGGFIDLRNPYYQKIAEASKMPQLAEHMTKYGMSHPFEAYAEAFAEWTTSAGRTANPMVKVFAQFFEWR